MASPKYSVLQVKPAKDSLIGQSTFVQFLSSLKSSLRANMLDRLLGTYDTICLEIINLNQTTFFVIACPERMEHLVRSQIAAQYPNALINPMEDYLPQWLTHGQPQAARLVLTAPSYLPINATDDAAVDQLSSVLGGLSRLLPGQAAIIQICLFAAPKNWQRAIRGFLDAGVGNEPEKFKAHPQKTHIETKLAYQAYSADIRLVAITPSEDQSKNLLHQLAAAYGTYSSSEGNSFSLKTPKAHNQQKLIDSIINRSAKYATQSQYLNYFEISALFHLPNANLATIKNIAWGKTLKGEPPANLFVEEGLTEEEKKDINFFAKTEFKNQLVSFGMKKGDDRRRHVYVLGKSGTGKSTLLANMCINDIRHGEGVALVDPHGDTAERILDYIPRERINDVAYLDPSVAGKSFHMNPLFVKNPAYSELVASGIVSIFSKLYGNSWGPRLEYILRNTLLTLVSKPGSTLLDVPRLLTSKPFREDYLTSVKDAVLINFWHDEYDKYSEKFQSEAISPILNKVGQFITSPTIRDIISHPDSTADFEDLMNQGKIIILNLPQGKIGEDNAALLGAMFISQIQIAAMNRANIPEEQRKDFFLYVDEFQNFATTSFIKILSEARKYRLNLILANQYTAQLPEEIQKAIFGNAGTLISFVVGADDANRLMSELGSFYTQDDLVSLPRYQTIIKLSVNSTISMPFPAHTLPVPPVTDTFRQQVIESSESRYYRPIVEQPMPVLPPYKEEPRREERRYQDQRPQRQYDSRPQQSQPPQRQYDSRPQQPQPPREYNPPRPLEPRPQYQQSQPPRQSPSPQTAQNTPQSPTPHLSPGPTPKEPTIEELDALRRQGLRPSVVGCFVNEKHLLLVYQKIHNMWTLPQGGIDNQETLEVAFQRELSDEVTEDFVKNTKKAELIAEDKIEFPPGKQGLRDMKLDSGDPVTMKGKYYYFLVSQANTRDIVVSATEFDDYKWLKYEEAYKLIKESNTGGKLRILTMILNKLRDKGLLAQDQIPPTRTNYQERPRYHGSKPYQSQPPRHQPNPSYSIATPSPAKATENTSTTGNNLTTGSAPSVTLGDTSVPVGNKPPSATSSD